MYSDIIPPNKKNKLSKIKAKKEKVEEVLEVHQLKNEPFIAREVYHTAYGQDRKSKLPVILVILTLITLSIVYYSVFNNKTNISFQPKSTIFEVKDIISMSLAEKNQLSSTTLSYNLIYNNENKDRNIFAPTFEESTSTLKAVTVSSVEYYTLNNSTTSPTTSIKVNLINESAVSVQVIKDTRFDVAGVTYYLDRAVNIKPIDKKATTTDSVKYKVIGFKGTSNYEKFYGVDYLDAGINTAAIATTTDNNFPNNDILSLIPENFISLKKNYIYDKNVDQTALVVIDKKDFEKVLTVNSKLIQEYVKSFNTIFDLVEYDISINDYELELDSVTGLPIAFKNLNLEIIPRIKKDKVASTFKGFSKDTMNKIKNEIAKNIIMNISYSPFWVTKVSDEDHISVQVK